MMKRLMLLATLLLVGAGANAILAADRSQESRASLSGVLSRSYATVGDLAAAAPDVVVAEAETRTNKQSGRLPFSEVSLRVQQVLKGGLSNGDVIRVLETGGTYTPVARDGSRPDLPKQEVDFDGVPVMQTSATYILFLRPYVGDIVDGGYAVLGVYQGKFKIGSNGRIEYTGRAAELAGSSFKVHRDTKDRVVGDVIAEISAAVK